MLGECLKTWRKYSRSFKVTREESKETSLDCKFEWYPENELDRHGTLGVLLHTPMSNSRNLNILQEITRLKGRMVHRAGIDHHKMSIALLQPTYIPAYISELCIQQEITGLKGRLVPQSGNDRLEMLVV